MSEQNIVVVGAGVAGLTTALLLSRHPGFKIVVTAKHMPGDYDIEYASPWAGANYMPVSNRGTEAAEWDKNSWAPLADLAKNHPEAGVHFQDPQPRKGQGICNCKLVLRATLTHSVVQGCCSQCESRACLQVILAIKTDLNEFRLLSKDELGPGVDSATSFTSVCINTAIYLPWLVSQCLANGVVFKRAVFGHISDATSPSIHPAGSVALVVNCTGLMASTLGGVEDKTVVPARGQIVIVRNDAGKMIDVSGTDDGDDEACYIMTRAAGGGTILGGSYQKGNWESQMDPNLAIRIMKRAVAMCPQLTGGKGIEHLDIIRHGVGLRPVREGGTRIERERIGRVLVVHNYGAGGAGYQSSYGCAQAAVDLVLEAFAPQAKL
ncbi:FAD dependent oxidoreductase [Aureobasidium sp. EXF-10727]|nr:FAD dependent oxidoreductase [Aureobasidium sp. EXF-10727]KAI4726047.1 FAD dependent oxidoreductase [Aureobasidium sp. EXF-10728]